jgi:WD40 repeat protein
MASCSRPVEDTLLAEIDLQREWLMDTISQTGFTRPSLLGLITHYIQTAWTGDSHLTVRPMIVHGESGTGKSWLLAHAVRWAQQQSHGLVTVARLVGSTVENTEAENLLRSICQQILRAYGEDATRVRVGQTGWCTLGRAFQLKVVAFEITGRRGNLDKKAPTHSSSHSPFPRLCLHPQKVPTAFEPLRGYFHRCLKLATGTRPLLIVLDGLDRLRIGSAGLQNLQWLHLERDLPPHVRFVVVTLPQLNERDIHHDLLGAAEALLPQPDSFVEVGPLSNEVLNASAACVLLKDVWGRTLTAEQSRAVVWAFDQHPTPLMLRLLLAVAAGWSSHTPFGEGPATVQTLAEEGGVAGIVNHLVDQWEEDMGKAVVTRILCLLCLSPAGVTPTEVLECLARDPEARRELAVADLRADGGVCQLVWSTLYDSLRAILIPRASGLTVVGAASGAHSRSSPHVAYVLAHRAIHEALFARYSLAIQDTWQLGHAFLAAYHSASDEHHVSRHVSGAVSSSGTDASTGLGGGLIAGGSGGLTAAGLACVSQAGGSLSGLSIALHEDPQVSAVGSSGSRFLARCGPCAAALLLPGAWLSARLRRTLQLLAHHQLMAGRLHRAEACLTDLSYVVLSVHAGMGATLLANLQLATADSGVVPAHLAAMTSIASEGISRLQGHPQFNLLQQALCFTQDERIQNQARVLVSLLPPLLRRAILDPNLPSPPKRTAVGLGSASPILACVSAGVSHVLASRDDRSVTIVDLEQSKTIGSLSSAKAPLVALAASGDGLRAIAAMQNGQLRCWSVPQGKSLAKASVPAFHGEVAQLCMCQDGELAAIRYSGGGVAVWILPGSQVATEGSGRKGSGSSKSSMLMRRASVDLLQTDAAGLAPLTAHMDLVTDCTFAPSGYTLATSSRDETVILWNARSGKVMRHLKGHQASVETCRFHPSGAFVITGSEDTTVCIWEVRSGKLLQKLEGHNGTPEICAFAPDFDCTKAVSASRDGVLRLWQIQGYGARKETTNEQEADAAPVHRELFFFAGITRCVNDCQFTPDGRLVVASSNSGKVSVGCEGWA